MSYVNLDPSDPTFKGRFGTLVEFILLNLGWPVVRVELMDKHITMAILEAVNKYHERAAMDYALRIETTNGQNQVDIPIDIQPQMIADVIFEGDVIDSYTNRLYSTGVMDDIGRYVFPAPNYHNILTNFDMAGYYLFLQSIEDFRKMTGINMSWEIINNQIQLYPANAEFSRAGILYQPTPTDRSIENTEWIREWALARSKFMLGTIRSKMSGFQVAGGNISSDGADLKAEATEDMNRLREELNLLQRPLRMSQF